jgi:transposase-like protein
MQSPTTLTEVAELFSSWRERRPSKRAHTPTHLKQLAVALLTQYPMNTVANALGTNHGRLSRWRRELDTSRSVSDISSEHEFVELPESREIRATKDMALTINYPSGVTLKLEGTPEDSMLHMILTSLDVGRRFTCSN